jgi:hypothetical protein
VLPISSLLFIIYFAPIHSVSLPRDINLSYVDDFSLTNGSPSYRTNTRLLQNALIKLQRIANTLYISFSIPKTEIMYWQTPCDRNPKHAAPISLNYHLFFPLDHLKWLGFWFSSTLTTHHHFQQRFAQASKTFGYLQSLSSPGTGLTAFNAHRLAQAVILPLSFMARKYLNPKPAHLTS